MKEKKVKTGIMEADLCIPVFLAWSRLASLGGSSTELSKCHINVTSVPVTTSKTTFLSKKKVDILSHHYKKHYFQKSFSRRTY